MSTQRRPHNSGAVRHLQQEHPRMLLFLSASYTPDRWFDLLMGTDSVRKAILKGESEEAIRNSWQKELQDYKEIRKKYLLYE